MAPFTRCLLPFSIFISSPVISSSFGTIWHFWFVWIHLVATRLQFTRRSKFEWDSPQVLFSMRRCGVFLYRGCIFVIRTFIFASYCAICISCYYFLIRTYFYFMDSWFFIFVQLRMRPVPKIKVRSAFGVYQIALFKIT